ncbi:glycosyltransferase family 2 protein [Patescibacteria group bacterium]|nr:glycosyltransferase family 2 protein [Patescibacteria group bacterium]
MLHITNKNQKHKEIKLAVVIPVYNEEKLIGKVLSTLPMFVDHIIVVDDCSKDKTVDIIRRFQQTDSRIILICHQKNQGVGGAISTGYQRALELRVDVTVVVNGDAQMDPKDMINLVKPVGLGEVDYCKGNRLFRGKSWDMIPHYRYLGNACLSLLTKIASGYWHITDSQSGYTAISLTALKTLDLKSIYKKYGAPNDLLIKLNIHNFKVRDVPIRPIYRQGEKSGIKLWKIIPTIPWLLIRGFFKRLWRKYVINDFHPLVFFYILAFLLLITSIPLSIRLVYIWIIQGFVPRTTTLAVMFLIITGLQFLFFAMWFDMEYNKNLK